VDEKARPSGNQAFLKGRRTCAALLTSRLIVRPYISKNGVWQGDDGTISTAGHGQHRFVGNVSHAEQAASAQREDESNNLTPDHSSSITPERDRHSVHHDARKNASGTNRL
jgi:hypothetical protein